MPKHSTSFFEILNKSEATKTVDLLLYGAIPSWDEDTYKMKNSAESFIKEFRALEKDYDRINIRINSPGGSLYHAFPIFNAILNSKKEIHTYNDGLAASAGGLLLLAGKTVHTAKNGILMIHNAQGMAFGSAERMREVAATLDTYDTVITKLFADRSGLTDKEVKDKYLNYKDHWLDAEEAKAAGFVHEIDEYESEDAPPSNITEMAFGEVLNLYREREEKTPGLFDRVLNYVKDAIKPGLDTAQPNPTNGATPTPTPTPEPTNTDTMNFKNSLDILAKGQLSPEDVAAVKAEIDAFTGANEKFTAEEVSNQVSAATAPLTDQITNLTTEKTNLATQVQTLTNEKTAIEGEKTTLAAQVTNLNLDIQAYRASGLKPTNAKGDTPDPIPGAGSADNFYCETDEAVKKLRAEAGIVPAAK